jgi:tRNA(Ser,Leu) C12 N-acetylase TAN1
MSRTRTRAKPNVVAHELASAVANLTTLVQNLTTRVEALAKESAPAEVARLKRFVHELAASFEQMKGVTKAAIEERERERQALVWALAADDRVPFSAEELESKPINELRKLCELAKNTWGPDWEIVQRPAAVAARGSAQRHKHQRKQQPKGTRP